jgi:hypothetical protein
MMVPRPESFCIRKRLDNSFVKCTCVWLVSVGAVRRPKQCRLASCCIDMTVRPPNCYDCFRLALVLKCTHALAPARERHMASDRNHNTPPGIFGFRTVLLTAS